jgi:hypothetical protein
MYFETQRSISPTDFENMTLIVENRDVDALRMYLGSDISSHRDRLHCYWLDEKIISLGSRDQQIAQVYQEYHPRVPWPKELVVYRRHFHVAAPVLAMISNATHERGHNFDVTVICRSFRREAWLDVSQSHDLPFLARLSLVFETETSEPYVPNLVRKQEPGPIKQLERDFSMPPVIQQWVFGRTIKD